MSLGLGAVPGLVMVFFRCRMKETAAFTAAQEKRQRRQRTRERRERKDAEEEGGDGEGGEVEGAEEAEVSSSPPSPGLYCCVRRCVAREGRPPVRQPLGSAVHRGQLAAVRRRLLRQRALLVGGDEGHPPGACGLD